MHQEKGFIFFCFNSDLALKCKETFSLYGRAKYNITQSHLFIS